MTVHACTLHGYVGAVLGGAASCSLGTFPLSHDLTRREKLKSVWVKTGWEEQSAKEKRGIWKKGTQEDCKKKKMEESDEKGLVLKQGQEW